MPNVNKTQYALLGVLSVGPASGYDIKKFCDKSISHFWNENYGHIYPVLKALQAEGLIAGEKRETEGKPPSTVYSITPKGLEELNRWLLLPVETTPTRHELLLKLIFSSDVPLDNTLEKLEAMRNLHAAHLEEYKRIEAAYESKPTLRDNPSYPYWMAALRYGRMDAEFRIRWCEQTIESLKNQADSR
jgi:DNA-binding PadR family transcriptional regulator